VTLIKPSGLRIEVDRADCEPHGDEYQRVQRAGAHSRGFFGFLIGPPLIGFAAELLGLRGALGMILVASALIVGLAGSVRRASPAVPGELAKPRAAGVLGWNEMA
jgi:hypothetical protein